MGIEIEIEQGENEDFASEIAGVCSKYLPGKHVLKEDGSLDNGIEIVSGAITHQAWNDVNLFGLCRELRGIGGLKSHDTSTCGIHVHLSRPDNKTTEKIRLFFSANRNRLKQFSRREWDRLNQWARIIEPRATAKETVQAWTAAEGKYLAVAKWSQTIEFRFFKGSLKYETIKACTDFTQAIYEFCSQHSAACVFKADSWGVFIEWASRQNRFRFLINYVKSKGI
jgi:hypothetical protein